MCLIIETRNNILIPKEVMGDMYRRNDDGYGLMYLKDGVVVGEKYQGKSLDQLYARYLETREYEPYIHLRMKTHGDINEGQSHPFDCGHGIWLMHNGVMDTQGEDKSKSDTWYFANEYLRPIFDQAKDPIELLKERPFQAFITRFIGSGNRIVMMAPGVPGLRFNNNSWHKITNEETGCVGMMVSNTYAWNMHTKIPQPQGKVHYMGESGWSGGPKQTGSGQKVIVPPGMTKRESHAGDPPGSFRDSNDKLWIYTGRGWMMYERYVELYPDSNTPFTTIVNGAKEVPQSHPTLLIGPHSAKTSASVWQRNGQGQGANKSNDSTTGIVESPPLSMNTQTDSSSTEDEQEEDMAELLQLDAYQDWLYENWKGLSYEEVHKMVRKEPEEAGDLIASLLGMKIKYPEGNK